MVIRRTTFLFLACFFLSVIPAGAAQPSAPPSVKDAPQIQADRSTAVTVEHEGTDTLGARLAFQLKGAFNTSSLFALTDKDEPKIKVLLSTAPEFPSRPNLASVYCVVWAFSQNDGTLAFLLARETGIVEAENVDALVTTLAERTDGMAAKYGYLFSR